MKLTALTLTALAAFTGWYGTGYMLAAAPADLPTATISN